MITRLLTVLAVFCCFSSYSNAQTIIDGDPTALNLADDSWSNVDLGFDVTYFGQTFDSISVYTNGMALFGDNRGYAGNCCNGYKPTQDQHDYGIFPFWTDLITINNNDEYNGVYYLGDGVDTFQIGWINIQEYYNNQTNNTFGLEIKSTSTGASIDFFYDELDIRNHSIWSGLTGDVSEGEVIENFFHNQQNGSFTGDSSLDWSYNVTSIDCSYPLNDPSCDGYEEAYTEQQCQQDPLYDQSCSGYEQAYFNQQCEASALYDPSCPGYETAYLNQQCELDSLYDQSCPGYEQAYEDQQCGLDSLWSPKCEGYYQAYETQQCELDSQYSITCPNFKFEEPEEFKFESFAFEDFSGNDDGSDYDAFGNVKQDFTFEEEFKFDEPKPEDFMEYEMISNNFVEEEFKFDEPMREEEFVFEEPELEFTPELDEFIPEDIREAIAELEQRIEEKEEEQEFKEIFEEFVEEEFKEEIEEDVVVITETTPAEVSNSGGETTQRRSGSRLGLSVGLGTANSLVAGLITNSIESGNSSAAQGVGTTGSSDGSGGSTGSGGYFEVGTGSISAISGGGVSFGEFTNTVTSDSQIEVTTSIALPSVSIGISLDTQTVKIEVREPTLAERIAERTRKQNLESQGGIFSKQESVLSTIASRTNLTKYYDERLSDADSFYVSEQVYKNDVLADNRASLWRMTNENYGLMNDLVRSQYGE